MFNFWNWKFNPFTQLFNPANFVGEQHIVAYDEDANAYGIRLNNLIELQGSLPFNTNINYGIWEDVTGGAKLTETPRTNPPDAGQFRVDYSANTYYSTSFIEFNSADDGLAVIVNYRQLGTVVKARYQLLSEVIFPANVGIQGNLDVTDDTVLRGNVSIAETTGSTINLNDKQASNMGDPVDVQDGVNLRSLDGTLPFRNYEELTASGTWTKPSNVSFVFIEAIGGGGGGGGAGSGGNNTGGGGASGELKRALIAVATNINYTIGAGGAGGTSITTNGNDGADGSDTVFSSLTASGGKGGKGSNNFYYGGSANSKYSIPGHTAISAPGTMNRGGNGGGYGAGLGGDGFQAIAPTAGTANTGGGGGGAQNATAGAAGGSGIIRLWY